MIDEAKRNDCFQLRVVVVIEIRMMPVRKKSAKFQKQFCRTATLPAGQVILGNRTCLLSRMTNGLCLEILS